MKEKNANPGLRLVNPNLLKLCYYFSTFAVKPAKGLLKVGQQIFVVKIQPKEVKTYKQKLKMKLNDNPKYDKVGLLTLPAIPNMTPKNDPALLYLLPY